jgi:hypothetical protein
MGRELKLQRGIAYMQAVNHQQKQRAKELKARLAVALALCKSLYA